MSTPLFRWGTVTGTNPLRIKLDGDTAALPVTPDSLIDPAAMVTADRVRVELTYQRVIIHGRAAGSAPVTGVVDPLWTYGKPSVTLSSGVVVSAFIGGYEPSPGDTVILERAGSLYYITSPGVRSAPRYLKKVPVPFTAAWKNYDSRADGGGVSDKTWNDPTGYYSLPAYLGDPQYIGSPAGVTRASSGWVLGQGLMYCQTAVTAGTTVATLPVGFRPDYPFKFTNIHANTYLVGTDGTIKPTTNIPVGNIIDLSHMRFLIGNGTSVLALSAFQNGWSNVGGVYRPARLVKDGMGFIVGQGAIKGGTVSDNAVIHALAAAWEPRQMNHMISASNTAPGGYRATGPAATSAGPNDALTFYAATGYDGTELHLDGPAWEDSTNLPPWELPAITAPANQYAGLATYSTISFCKTADSLVHLRGFVGGLAGSTTIFYLPIGYRPRNRQIFMVDNSSGALGRVDVLPNGMVVQNGGGNTWLSLDGLTFPAEW